METCTVCKKPFDSPVFPVADTGWCSRCAGVALDWINNQVLCGIRERGDSAGIDFIHPDRYYLVGIDWFIGGQVRFEYTIMAETDQPQDDEPSFGIFSGLSLAVQMDRTNRFHMIQLVSYICCDSGRVYSLDELCPEW